MNPEYSATDRPLDGWARNRTLTRIADALQPAIRALLAGDDPGHRTIGDLLHGTFLGHPLHPLLTDIPIGAWTITAVCDALELRGSRRYRDGADLALVVGALGAVAAAATGLADWSDTKDEPQRLGMLHAILNGAALTSYVMSLIARKRSARRAGITAAFAGYGLMALAAYLGGELSFGMQLGVKHTAIPLEPPPDFVPVIDAAQLTDGEMQAAAAATIPLLVTRYGSAVHAVSGVCTHRGAALAAGRRTATAFAVPGTARASRSRTDTSSRGRPRSHWLSLTPASRAARYRSGYPSSITGALPTTFRRMRRCRCRCFGPSRCRRSTCRADGRGTRVASPRCRTARTR